MPRMVKTGGADEPRWYAHGQHVAKWENRAVGSPAGRFKVRLGVGPSDPKALYQVGGVSLLRDLLLTDDFTIHSEVGKTIISGSLATSLDLPIPARSSRIEVVGARRMPVVDTSASLLLGNQLVPIECAIPYPVNPRSSFPSLLSLSDFLAKGFMFCFDRNELCLFR